MQALYSNEAAVAVSFHARLLVHINIGSILVAGIAHLQTDKGLKLDQVLDIN